VIDNELRALAVVADDGVDPRDRRRQPSVPHEERLKRLSRAGVPRIRVHDLRDMCSSVGGGGAG
jgi:hypothetical protein